MADQRAGDDVTTQQRTVVGWYCVDCKKLKPTREKLHPCGQDYGPNHVSHLDVHEVYFDV